MMKKVLYILPLFLLIFSCTKRIDLDLNTLENQRLVVEGWITNILKEHEIKLSLTSDYFNSGSTPRATNAIVTVSDGDQTWTFSEVEPGIYRSIEFQGEFGKTYTLDILWSDEEYTASSELREVAPLEDVDFEYVDPMEEFGFEGDPWYDVLIWTQELEGEGDSYYWPIYVNGENVRENLVDISFSDDEFIDGSAVVGIAIDNLTVGEEANPGDTIYLEQWNIGRPASDYFVAILSETDWRGGIFDTPPANIESNVSNGALGYFGAAGVVGFETVIPE